MKKGVDADASKRYQSADELIRAIDDRAEGKVPIRCPITFTKRTTYEVMRFVTGYPRLYMGMLGGAAGAAIYFAVK